MKLTEGQINEARSGGKLTIRKWGNEKKEKNTKGVVPYRFDNDITKKETVVVKRILARFNKDLKGCLSIK